MQPRRPRTKVQRDGHERARRLRQQVADEIATLREDAGLSRRALAGAAGISASTQADIEAGRCVPSLEALARIAAALGASLNVRLYPGAGPLVRDHLQAAMLQALLRVLHPRWRRELEVPIHRPVRGVIDLVLEERAEGVLVACEARSELRRIEQQLRWATTKAAALTLAREGAGVGDSAVASPLLLLRSARSTRAVAREYAELLRAALPARYSDLLAALSGTAPWPGAGLLWCDVDRDGAHLLERPPRGISLGR